VNPDRVPLYNFLTIISSKAEGLTSCLSPSKRFIETVAFLYRQHCGGMPETRGFTPFFDHDT
jgi:hypothetical protein